MTARSGKYVAKRSSADKVNMFTALGTQWQYIHAMFGEFTSSVFNVFLKHLKDRYTVFLPSKVSNMHDSVNHDTCFEMKYLCISVLTSIQHLHLGFQHFMAVAKLQ